MEHRVLYRKYRPDNFESIIGQDVIINTLKNAIKNDKVAHAYIFSGPRGTGKTSTAKVFAKALNCLDYNDGPCNKCSSCVEFSNNPDIIEIDAASNNGVDDVRELINNVRLAPSVSKYKVYIIDEVHMLTTNAFNALLLTLEEPPSNVVFIFATTNIESVPITILSRCQRFDFNQISLEYLKERLKYVANSEKIDIDDDAITEICSISEGGLRDALSILDQLSSQSSVITLDTVQKSFNIIGLKTINIIIDYIFDNKKAKLIQVIDEIQQKAYDFKNVVKKIIEQLYLRIVEENIELSTAKKIVLELNSLLNEVNIYVNPYILLKVVLLSYNQPSDTSQNIKCETVSSHPNVDTELQSESQNYFPGNNFDEKIEKIIEIRINNTFVEPTKEKLKENQELWQKLINNLSDSKLMSLLVDTKLSASSSTNAIISTDLEATSHLINVSLSRIEDEFYKKFNQNIKFVCVTTERWQILKKEYSNNIRNNIKYTFVEESDLGYNDEVLKDIAKDIFKNTKIEME